MGSQVNGQTLEQTSSYMGNQIDSQAGIMGGQMAQMPGGPQQQQPQQTMGSYQPFPGPSHTVAGASMPGVGGGLGHAMSGQGTMGGGAMNGSMMGSLGGFPAASAPPQRPSKKVPDWLVQTLKQQEALEAKQKKKGGISLSTDVTSSVPGGTGNISGYNLVHSPSPSPPGSPSDRAGGESGKGRSKPSWQDDSDDDSADEVSPKKVKEPKKAANGSVDAAGRNGSKPSGILKKSTRGMGRVLEEDDVKEEEEEPTVAESATMDDATRDAFDREIMRLLTRVLKEGTDNIIHEVASSEIKKGRDSATVAPEALRRAAEPQSTKVNHTQQREQKKAMGALIGSYGSESASESDGGTSPPQTTAPSATITGEVGDSPEALEGSSKFIAASGVTSPEESPRKPKVMVGRKWPLPSWADPPHEAPLPDGMSIVVETTGPNLERIRTQELSFSTTVLGRSEEHCGFVVEDSSASRWHAAIL